MRLFLGSFAKIDNFKDIKDDFKDIVFAKWVEINNIHLTYLFLGEVENPQKIISKLDGISYKKDKIFIKSLGLFGHPPKILYAKIKSKEILKLYKKICKKLEIEEKYFTPHITLARIKRVNDKEKFFNRIGKYKNRKLGYLELNLTLIESTLTPKGPLYKIIKKF